MKVFVIFLLGHSTGWLFIILTSNWFIVYVYASPFRSRDTHPALWPHVLAVSEVWPLEQGVLLLSDWRQFPIFVSKSVIKLWPSQWQHRGGLERIVICYQINIWGPFSYPEHHIELCQVVSLLLIPGGEFLLVEAIQLQQLWGHWHTASWRSKFLYTKIN